MKLNEKAKQILEYLRQFGDSTSPDAGERLDMHRNTADYHFATLHKAGLIHVVEYKRSWGTRGHWARVWRAGPGQDAKEPKADEALYQERYHAKLKGLVRARRLGPLDPFEHMVATLCSLTRSSSPKAPLPEKTRSRRSRTSRSKTGKSGDSTA